MKRVIKLDKNISLKLDTVDDWLKNVFKIELISFKSDILSSLNEKQIYIVQITWRVLLLRKTLLQAVNIPVFETGDIISIDEKKQYFILTLDVTIINNTNQKIYITIMNFIFNYIFKVVQNEKNIKSIEYVFESIKSDIIIPLTPLSVAGQSTIPILETAYKMKIPFEHISEGVYKLGLGSKSKVMFKSTTALDSIIGLKLSENKMNTANFIRDLGLPAPEHILVNSYEEALEVTKKISSALVVKPADLNRGEGVSVDIVNNTQLKYAFENAYNLSPSKQVLVEKQVEGVCYRIFIYHGKMLYAVKRLPKSVIGDGKTSVEKLVEQANIEESQKPPWNKTQPFPFDDLALKSIHDAGFTPKSIPKEGDIVPLRRIESTQDGGYDFDVTKNIHKDNIAIAIKVAKAFCLDVVGVDIISSDITQAWYVNGAIINELNYAPLYGRSAIGRATIPLFLKSLLQGDGRIPISVIIGNDKAMQRARQIIRERQNKGISAYITTDCKSYKNATQEIHVTCTNIYQRVHALLLDTDVDELILVIQNDDILKTGLPINKIDTLMVEDKNINNIKNILDFFNVMINPI